MFPLYEHFVISTFTCLRRWMTAPEADPDDTSYWDQPPPAPTFMPAEPKKKKKGKKPRFRTTTVPPSADFTVCEICVITSSDYYMALCVCVRTVYSVIVLSVSVALNHLYLSVKRISVTVVNCDNCLR